MVYDKADTSVAQYSLHIYGVGELLHVQAFYCCWEAIQIMILSSSGSLLPPWYLLLNDQDYETIPIPFFHQAGLFVLSFL